MKIVLFIILFAAAPAYADEIRLYFPEGTEISSKDEKEVKLPIDYIEEEEASPSTVKP